ncbi:plant dual-specificity MAP kinase kinase family domain protein (macronuclear) [Tetrahymena thermophila SB210]|uniref:Plant dual-specificity MAP kinase kinase family domain protein n=1 Tax=Tetrahymena thermophila (strain SB210) TaxID=312017 RepID=Q22D22_TETTS|nr:plant dual-specificity MAP kinase kinase family domain protein [Tetrahymena thermophila SB210]EAR83167.2 plant dual-specificity MAP kinase kinase family domain protein [Tetrahymena thermophila SB210]|eukprot:XP_001030830.2 plant dual-specificity MAP kinase kinase family domain protein [Tetrahymena thermophila SB210]
MNSLQNIRKNRPFPVSSYVLESLDSSQEEINPKIRAKHQTFIERRPFSGNRAKNLSINIGDSRQSRFKNSKMNKKENFSTAIEFYQNYEILEKIGEGGSSVVKQCRNKKSGQLLVVKIIKYSDTERVFSIIQEGRILSGLNHPNIIKNHGFYIDTTKKTCYIIMEKAEGLTLSQCTVDSYIFTNYKMSQITKSLLQTLNYLHLNHICHRDITPNNIFYNQGSIKLIDFSISKDLGNCLVNGKMYSQNGNIVYMAPEVLQGKVYDKSVDVWGVGITILTTFLGYNPFVDENGYELSSIRNICEKELDFTEYKQIDPSAINLLQQMLQKDPEKRITVEKALKHEWLEQKIDKEELTTPQFSSHKFKRHSVFVCNNNLSLSTQSNKVNFKRGSFLFIKYIAKSFIAEDADDENQQDQNVIVE